MASRAEIAREYLSPDEAQTLTGLSKWTWRKKAYEGEIASAKVGSRLLLPIAEVNRVIAEGMRPRVVKFTDGHD